MRLVTNTHALFTMKDIQVNLDDDELNLDLRSTYRYEKTEIAYNNMKELYDCPYLGGIDYMEKTKLTQEVTA